MRRLMCPHLLRADLKADLCPHRPKRGDGAGAAPMVCERNVVVERMKWLVYLCEEQRAVVLACMQRMSVAPIDDSRQGVPGEAVRLPP